MKMILSFTLGFIVSFITAYCTANNVFKHLKTILIHKWWVFIYCCKCGLVWRGIKHDMSKFSPTEFFESIKYYTGTSSPIDACKKVNGYSKAWQHHKGNNTHHYEHWTDNYDSGTTYIQMPLKDAMEMICDYLAAARAYMGKNFTYEAEYDWWTEKKLPTVNAMHPVIKRFITDVLYKLYRCDNEKRYQRTYFRQHEWKFNKKNLIKAYKEAENIVNINIKNGMEK